MKVFKIIVKTLFILLFLVCLLCTLYFLFAHDGYGIDEFSNMFEQGFLSGIKLFFINIWEGIKHVFQ